MSMPFVDRGLQKLVVPLVKIWLGIAQMCKCCDASEVVLVCIWIFRGSGSAMFVVLLGVGQPGNHAIGVMLPV